MSLFYIIIVIIITVIIIIKSETAKMSSFPRNDGSAADSFALILNSDKLYGSLTVLKNAVFK